MRKARFNMVPPILALALLCVVTVETYSRPQPGNAEPYHALVRKVAESIPERIGNWVGVDRPRSEDAERLLRPNVMYARIFRNKETGWEVSVLIVHCKDARNLEGHYPPVCYPSSGMKQLEAAPRDWKVAGLNLPGIQYTFADKFPGKPPIHVDNFLILPPKFDKDLAKVEDGVYVPDMQGVNRNAWDFMRRYFGAAQVQVLFQQANLSTEQREAIFKEMITAHKDLIEAIRSGAMP